MPFGFPRKIKEKTAKVGRDLTKNHEKEKKDRDSSRGRAHAYEQDRKEKVAMERKMKESKDKILQMSNDLRAKTDQISELLTAVNDKTTENEELRKNVKELEKKIHDLETRLENDEHLIRIEPKYFAELKSSVQNCSKLESLLHSKTEKLNRFETDSAKSLATEQSTNRQLRADLDRQLLTNQKTESKFRKNVENVENQLKTVQHENELLSSNQILIQSQLRDTDQEKNILENELKKSMKNNSSLESELQKLKDELKKREKMEKMEELMEKLEIVENQLRDSMLKNQEKDEIILKKDEKLENQKNRIYQIQNDLSEKDNEVEKQRNMINDLRYKIKDDSERFESQFEETMMMHTRQLQSLRQSVDPGQVTRLESDLKRARDQIKSEQELNRQKTVQLTELKTKCSRLELRSRITDDTEKYKNTIDELRSELKVEKSGRNEEKLNYETIIHNLRGHMLNIYAGNVSPDMEKVLNTALQLEKRKQQQKSRNS